MIFRGGTQWERLRIIAILENEPFNGEYVRQGVEQCDRSKPHMRFMVLRDYNADW